MFVPFACTLCYPFSKRRVMTSGMITSRCPHSLFTVHLFPSWRYLQILAHFQYSLRGPCNLWRARPLRSLQILSAGPDKSNKGSCTNTKPSSWGLYNSGMSSFQGSWILRETTSEVLRRESVHRRARVGLAICCGVKRAAHSTRNVSLQKFN
jgi:hypothetical protein